MRTIFLTLLILGATLSAKTPAWVNEINVTKPGPFLEIRPVQLTYELSWNGKVKAGVTHIRFGQKDPRYPNNFIAQSYGNTTGFARGLYKFDFNFTSFLRPSNYRPQVFVAEEKWANKVHNTTTRFQSKSVNSQRKELHYKNNARKTKDSSFAFPNVLGAHGAVLWVRSLDLKPGQEAVFVTMPLDQPYLARVKHLGKEVHASRRAHKLELKLQKINKKTLELKDYSKMKSLILWLSDDAERLPIEFRSKVFIGDVRVVLTSKSYL